MVGLSKGARNVQDMNSVVSAPDFYLISTYSDSDVYDLDRFGVFIPDEFTNERGRLFGEMNEGNPERFDHYKIFVGGNGKAFTLGGIVTVPDPRAFQDEKNFDGISGEVLSVNPTSLTVTVRPIYQDRYLSELYHGVAFDYKMSAVQGSFDLSEILSEFRSGMARFPESDGDLEIRSIDDYLGIVDSLDFSPVDDDTWRTISGPEGLDWEMEEFDRRNWVMATLPISEIEKTLVMRIDGEIVEKFNVFDIKLKQKYGGRLVDLIDYNTGVVKIVKTVG